MALDQQRQYYVGMVPQITIKFLPTSGSRAPIATIYHADHIGGIQDARRIALCTADRDFPDCKRIELLSDDESVRQIWVKRDDEWRRDDGA